MSDAVRKRRFLAITARPSADEKRRLQELAARRGLSESGVALLAIRHYLDLSNCGPEPLAAAPSGPATDRITIRLRPGDGDAIRRRALERHAKASNYIAGLVRAHLAANPPLVREELQALKIAVAVLAGAGRTLHEVARAGLASGQFPEDVRQQISRTGAAVRQLEKYTRAFAQAALVAWESDLG